MKFHFVRAHEVADVLHQAGRKIELNALSHLIHQTIGSSEEAETFGKQHGACLADRNSILALSLDLLAQFAHQKEEKDAVPEGS